MSVWAIKGLVTSGLALPLSSAIFAAGALTFVNRLFAIADMARVPRLIIVLLIAINPMFVFYAMNGTGDAAYMMLGALALFSLIGWGPQRIGPLPDRAGQPELFFDRIARGDQEWEAALLNPTGRVEFMLVERSDSDLILQQYPGAVEGEVPFLESVAANDRYALLRVIEGVDTSQGADRTGIAIDDPRPAGTDRIRPPLTRGPPPGSER